MLSTFDAPDVQSVCTRRQRSNTPLQALTMANDVAMYELAQELAMRALERFPDGEPDAKEKRVRLIFERALSRPPQPGELKWVMDSLARSDAADAGDDQERWIAVARAVMNTDEFITRE